MEGEPFSGLPSLAIHCALCQLTVPAPEAAAEARDTPALGDFAVSPAGRSSRRYSGGVRWKRGMCSPARTLFLLDFSHGGVFFVIHISASRFLLQDHLR